MGTQTEIRIIHSCFEICYGYRDEYDMTLKNKMGIFKKSMS